MAEPAEDFDRLKRIASAGSEAERLGIARRPDVAPELLYFLAADPAATVRRAIAENPSTPRQADLILSQDPDIGVRCLLARKIVGAGLGDDQRGQLWRMGFTILETLMRDQSIRVRRALSEAVKFMFNVPHDVAVGLARDPEPRVAVPMLRHSPVLTDADLIDIVEGGAPPWAQQAIAARDDVSERLSAALVDAGATRTVTRLLKNTDATIADPTLETIVERAPEIEEWHEPLVRRPRLSEKLVQKIGQFVAAPLKAALNARPAADPAAAKGADRAGDAGTPGWSPRETKKGGALETAKDRALRLYEANKLTDGVIEMALNASEREFVLAALALRAGVPLWGVERIVFGRSAKGLTALCWKAGVQMRFAIELQRRLARIPASQIVHARDGFDYPFSEEDMRARLELLLA